MPVHQVGVRPRAPEHRHALARALRLHRFAIQAEDLALRVAQGVIHRHAPSWSREPLWLACAASLRVLDLPDHGRPL